MSGMVTSAVLSLVLLPNTPSGLKAIQTQGSVRIQEAAGISVLNTAPLQLMLSSDTGMWITPAIQSGTGSDSGSEENSALADGGLFASITTAGEVLSVSVGDTEAVETSAGKKFKRIIAQFN